MKLVLVLNVMCALLLTACASPPGTGTQTNCAGWRLIKFSAKNDSPETIKQIMIHDRRGQLGKCWK